MQLDILAMTIQLKVGGKTHEIVEEQAIGNCKTGLSPLPYRGFSKPDTNWMCCVKAAYMVLHDTLSAFPPVSTNISLVKTELRVGRLHFELWYLATIVNCNLNHRTYHSSKLARTWLLVFTWQADCCILVQKGEKKHCTFVFLYCRSIYNSQVWRWLPLQDALLALNISFYTEQCVVQT